MKKVLCLFISLMFAAGSVTALPVASAASSDSLSGVSSSSAQGTDNSDEEPPAGYAEKLLYKKDSESGLILGNNFLSDTIGGSGWNPRGYFSSKVVLEKNSYGALHLGNLIRYHGMYQDIDLKNLSGYVPEEVSDYYGRITFKVKKVKNTNEPLVFLLQCYNTSSASYGEQIFYKTIALNSGEWQTVDFGFDPLAAYNALGTDELLRFECYLGDTNNSTSYDDYSDYYFSDIGVYVYKESETANIAVNESEVIKTVGDDYLGAAYEIHNALYSRGALKSDGAFTDEFLAAAGDVKSNVVRLGGYSYNYSLWKKEIGPFSQREKYYYKTPTGYWRLNEPSYTGIIENLDLAYINGPQDIIYCLNMWSVKPDGATEKYLPVEIVTVTETKNEDGTTTKTETINESYLNTSIQDAIDVIRFLTLSPDDERAVGSDGVNWAQKRVDLGYESPVNVTYWELGNEFYLRNISPQMYVTLCERYIDEIEKVFPDLKYLAQTYDTWSDWNNVVIPGIGDRVHGLTYHLYYPYDKMNTQSIKNLNAVISSIEKNGYAEKLKLHLTEFGLAMYASGYSGPYMNDSGQAIALAGMMNRMYRVKQIDSIQYFLGCFLMIDIVDKDTPIFSTPTRTVLNEYITKAQGQVLDTKVTGDFEGHNTDISAAAFKTDEGIRLFVTNLADSPRKVNFSAKHVYTVAATEMISCNSLYDTYRSNPEDIVLSTEGEGNLFSGIELPKYSTVIIDLKEKNTGITSVGSTFCISGRAAENVTDVSASLCRGNEEILSLQADISSDGSYIIELDKGSLKGEGLTLNIMYNREIFEKYAVSGNSDYTVFESLIQASDKKFTYVCTADKAQDGGVLLLAKKSSDGAWKYDYKTVPFRNGAGLEFGLNGIQSADKMYLWRDFDSIEPLTEPVTVGINN